MSLESKKADEESAEVVRWSEGEKEQDSCKSP